MGNPVVHWEFWSSAPEAIARFYAEVFGWKTKHVPQIDYHIAETGGSGGIDGGIMKPEDAKDAGATALYIDVDELETYTVRIAKEGGRVLVPRMDVPNVGSFALFADPDGRVVGLWKKG